MFKGLGQLGDMAKLMKQAQDMQQKMYEDMKKMKEGENDKSTDVSNINKSG